MKKNNQLFLWIAGWLCSYSLSAQYPGDVIELSKAPTVSEVTACHSVVLKPGFSFSASPGRSLTLKADPSVCSSHVNEDFSVFSLRNYILTVTPLDETDAIEIDDVRVSVSRGTRILTTLQCFDGLGRLEQTVQKGIVPMQDLITLQEYDSFGRESNTWLPTPVSSYNISPVKPYAQTYYNDSRPYSEPEYERSPLNRVLSQYGPGEAWKLAARSIRTNYRANGSNYPCAQYEIVGQRELRYKGNYDAGQLYVTEMIDEDNNISYEFKNKSGQVVLNRQKNEGANHDTYYVYDNFDNLVYVLPPLAADVLKSTTGTYTRENNEIIRNYAYVYEYDSRRRCIKKKLPGCDWILYVYDRIDQLILSQDGEQRTKNEWTFNKYDDFGRLILSGIYPCSESHERLCARIGEGVGVETFTGGDFGYSEEVEPFVSSDMVYLVNYYDNYDRLLNQEAYFRNMLSYEDKEGYGKKYVHAQYPGSSAKGLLTGTRVKLMDGSGEVVTAMYYDGKGRIIQQKSTNHLNGIDKVYYSYTFTGSPTKMLVEHTSSMSPATIKELYTYSYDQAGRLTETWHQLNDQTEVVLARNEYDEIGRLIHVKKADHSKLETRYSYNIRSWMKSIQSPLFEQQLYYTEEAGGAFFEGNVPSYSGNISAMTWTAAGAVTHSNHSQFRYDNLSRLIEANYAAFNPVGGTEYIREQFEYDKHGNFNVLNRYQEGTYLSTGYSDNLSFRYNGNQLKKVYESGSLTDGFVKYSNQDTEYTFDANGSMTKDLNKGISSIAYNFLHLPRQMDIKSPVAEARNSYLYNANGTKLRVIQQWNSNYPTTPIVGSAINESALNKLKQTDYSGNKVYENSSLKFLLVDGGYYDYRVGEYYFYQQDHLRNNRVTADSQGNVAQSINYLAFGNTDQINVFGEEHQPYLYNGKEFDAMHGLDMYDSEARMYNLWGHRWDTMDPLAEKYYSISPYAYCGNNPVNSIDPNGMNYYFLREDGKIILALKTEDNHDYLFGGYNGEKVHVNDQDLLPQIEGKDNTQASGITTNAQDAFIVFKFAADNSIPEWSLKGYSPKKEGVTFFLLSTSYDAGKVSSKKGNYNSFNLLFSLHSHPVGSDNLGPSGSLTSPPNSNVYIPSIVDGGGDLYSMISNFNENPNAKHYIYHTGTRMLIYYDHLTSVNEDNQNKRGRYKGIMKSSSQMHETIIRRKKQTEKN